MEKNNRSARISQIDRIRAVPAEKKRSTRREWEDYVRRILKSYRNAEQSTAESGFLEGSDLAGPMERRRVSAMLNMLNGVCQRYSSFPAATVNRLGEAWVQLNYQFNTYSELELQSHILTAASIWILDRIRDNEESWIEMIKLLPGDDRFLDEIEMPDLWDPVYEWELIAGIQWLLQNRNGSPERDRRGCLRCITDVPTAQGKHRSEDRRRKAFETLLSLIPEEEIRRAEARFTELFWVFSDRTFSSLEPLESQMRTFMRNAEASRQAYNAAADELDEAVLRLEELRSGRNRAVGEKKPVLGRLPDLKQLAELAGGMPGFNAMPEQSPIRSAQLEIAELMRKLDSRSDQFDKAVDGMEQTTDRINRFLCRVSRQGYFFDCEDFGEEAEISMARLEIGDPYELCFALLYLVDRDSDLPWAYGVGAGLMEEVCECLPWGVCDYDEDEDAYLSAGDGKHPVKVPANAAMPDFKGRNYEERGAGLFNFPRSLEQLIYEETGCLMPRDMHVYDSRLQMLKRFGIHGKDAAVALACMSFGAQCRRQRKSYLDTWSEAEEADASENLEASLQLGDLQRELKRVKAALHEAEKTARDTRKELQSVKARAELERRELTDLREFVFNLDAEETAEEDIGAEFSFPYEVRKDTVVFGGHAAWVKAVRPLLRGNVRFVDKELYTFDPAIIRSADVVWIQPNAMSHAQYYRVIDTARLYKKTVRYFTQSSAAKGARQVAENDLAQE